MVCWKVRHDEWLGVAFIASSDDTMDTQFVFQSFVVLMGKGECACSTVFEDCGGETAHSQTWVGPDDVGVLTEWRASQVLWPAHTLDLNTSNCQSCWHAQVSFF